MGSFIECPNNPNELNLLDCFQDKRYAQGKGFITMALNSCHTSSLPTPEDKEQAQQTHVSLLSGFSPEQVRQCTGVTRLQVIRGHGNWTCRERWRNIMHYAVALCS